MTSSPPADAPYFRGKTLTPESPRPLHIPEPSNIPVLENQIDPIFNLMSTHMSPPYAARNMTAMDQDMVHFHASEDTASAPVENLDRESSDKNQDKLKGSGMNNNGGGKEFSLTLGSNGTEAEQGSQAGSSLNHNQASSLTDPPSASMASLDVLSTSISSQTNPSNTFPVANATHDLPDPLDISLYSPKSNEQTTTLQAQDPKEVPNSEAIDGGGVNYQALLDNIVPSNATESSITNYSPGNNPSLSDSADVPAPSSANLPPQNFTAPVGLPPRPPPQEKPAIHPNYVPGEDIRSYHYPHLHHANAQPSPTSQQSSSFRGAQSFQPAPGTGPGSNGLPPPPMPSFQQQARGTDQNERNPSSQQQRQRDAPPKRQNIGGRDDEAPWATEIQKIYDQFLDDEAIYTAEGTWDKFPQGSRLFVGNLPTEIVTKRDIFHIFYRYGRLAQISIKQAYGFVQFMDTNASMTAMQAEQGGKIKDRNMHLEISKPPKNSRNAATSAAGDRLRASHYRRSRSPEHNRRPGSRGQRGGNDRFNRNHSFSDYRDEPRRRDDYRPGRSPSPRGFRGRDEYRGGRDRTPDRYYGGRDRSRSPYGRTSRHNRSPSPPNRVFDEDASLPIPRRNPRDVPDVQLILVDELDRAFIDYIQKSFRDRGLGLGILQAPPHVSLAALIKRQILEGVQAVVKVSRTCQASAKIPLQLFDRTAGVNQVRFEEYNDLDLHVAAELVVRSKEKQAVSAVPQPQFNAAALPYGAGQALQQPIQQQNGGQPNLANLITQLDGPALQKLLGAMQHTPQTPQSLPQQSPTQNPGFAALMANAVQQTTPTQGTGPGFPYPPPQQQQQHQQPQQPSQYHYGPYQQIPQQPQQQQGPHALPQQYPYPQTGQPQHQVQDIMQQLAKWKK